MRRVLVFGNHLFDVSSISGGRLQGIQEDTASGINIAEFAGIEGNIQAGTVYEESLYRMHLVDVPELVRDLIASRSRVNGRDNTPVTLSQNGKIYGHLH